MTADSCPASEGERPRVLIVDDHALSNRVMTLVLRIRGFQSIAVTSEAQALVSIEEFQPDVVILEWANRHGRTVEQAARFRRLAGRRIAIIVVTHEATKPGVEVLGHVDGYFTKPVALESLEQTIHRATARIQRSGVG